MSGCGMSGELQILPRRLALKMGRTKTISTTFWIGPTITMQFLGSPQLTGATSRYLQRPQLQSIPTPKTFNTCLQRDTDRYIPLRTLKCQSYYCLLTNIHLQTLPSPNPTHAILNLLSELCDRLHDPWDPRSRNQDYHNSLRTIESRAENILSTPSLATSSADTKLGVKIWQLATRIYLARASQSQWVPSINLESEIQEAFNEVVTVCLCKHSFPLLIVACEAHTDERRAAIIDLIDRTERGGMNRNFKKARAMIHSIWVQQDLYADSDLLVNYLGIISTVISSNTTLPFVVQTFLRGKCNEE